MILKNTSLARRLFKRSGSKRWFPKRLFWEALSFCVFVGKTWKSTGFQQGVKLVKQDDAG